jgi:type II secretory pathway pseudopilin PulG
MNVSRNKKQSGFSMLEALIVVSIILILGAMMMPRMLQVIDRQKLQSNVQAYAGLLQTARMRAAGDDTVYQPLIGGQNGATVAYVDINGDGQYNPQGVPPPGDPLGPRPEPGVQLANPITVTDAGAPADFDAGVLIGMQPLNFENSPMVTAAGVASPGIAFNERGLPCQRTVAGGPCRNTVVIAGKVRPVGWVTYFQYRLRAGGIAWGAVTVTPAGRVKNWIYQNDGQGGGTWH